VDSFVIFAVKRAFIKPVKGAWKRNKMKLGKTYKLRAISQNTNDIGDLINDCMNFLRSLTLSQETVEKLAKTERKLREIENISNNDTKYKIEKTVLFHDIFEILDSIAPEGCYFGSHPVDSMVIGFWDKALFSATR
jgi:hypothetical protein